MQTQRNTVPTTIRLMPEAREFLESVAPGRSKGRYLGALLLQERVRRDERERRVIRSAEYEGVSSTERAADRKAGVHV
jgi:hypothetical protein